MSIHRYPFLTVKSDDFIESKTVNQSMHKTNREIQDQSVGLHMPYLPCFCYSFFLFIA